MRLWTLADLKSPRRQNIEASILKDIEASILVSNFKDSDTLIETAQYFLRRGIINTEDLHFDKQGRPIVTCQYSFGGRTL